MLPGEPSSYKDLLVIRSAWYSPAAKRSGTRPLADSQTRRFALSSISLPVEILMSCAGTFSPFITIASADEGRSVKTKGCESQKTATRVSLTGLLGSLLGLRLKDRIA